jgi:hypothetical protein
VVYGMCSFLPVLHCFASAMITCPTPVQMWHGRAQSWRRYGRGEPNHHPKRHERLVDVGPLDQPLARCARLRDLLRARKVHQVKPRNLHRATAFLVLRTHGWMGIARSRRSACCMQHIRAGAPCILSGILGRSLRARSTKLYDVAACCATLQHVLPRCMMLQHVALCRSVLYYVATCCTMLQARCTCMDDHAMHEQHQCRSCRSCVHHVVTQGNEVRHSTTCCNVVQHSTTCCNTGQRGATQYNMLRNHTVNVVNAALDAIAFMSILASWTFLRVSSTSTRTT